MQPYSYEILEQYLDGELPEDKRSAINASLSTNATLKTELTALVASAEAVRYYGIAEQVAAIQKEYLSAKQPARVRSIMRPMLRVAASIIIIFAAFSVYKYSTATTQNLTADYYSTYELNRVRGEENNNALENAYNNKDWNTVITLVNQSAQKDSKQFFLAGSAYFELNQPARAISSFENALAYNQRAQTTDFNDDAEYYLAMSYIANHQAAKAIPIIKSIRNNRDHLYNQKASKISMLDLKIVSWK